MPSAALMQRRSLRLQAMPLILLLLLLLLLPTASLSRRQRQKKRWKQLPVLQLPPTECGHEFRDAQSKWLQSELVVRATWRASDESTPTRSGTYNITMTVSKQMKPWRQNVEGRRITVGTFNRTRARDQRAKQRQTCVPCDLRRRRVGYVFFLEATPDPSFFRLAFLPIRFKQRLKNKFNRVQCKEMQACPRAPELVKEVRKRIRRTGGSGGMRQRLRLRLVCRAKGLPRPRPLWLRDGDRIELGRGKSVQFRTRKRIVTSRLVMRNAAPEDAGNYTCVFRNLQGSSSSSIIITAEDLSPMGQQTSTATPQPETYLCNYNNTTYCLNGGTCVISRITNEPSCRCSPEYMGFFCENLNIEYMYREQIKKSLIRNLAVAGTSGTTLSATSLLAAIVLIAMFVVLLAICCMVVDIRRRLDRKHWTSRARKLDIDDEELESRLASTIRRPPPPLLDATTMTESHAQLHLEPPVPLHREQPLPHIRPQNQLNLYTDPTESALSNGPTSIAVPAVAAPLRSRNSSAQGAAAAPLSYTYRSPGLPPNHQAEFRIHPVFNYADVADDGEGGKEDGEAIDLMKEFRQVELLQQQQQQQQQQQHQQQQHQQQQQQRQQQQKQQDQQKKASVKRPLPFPGHGTPSSTSTSSSK